MANSTATISAGKKKAKKDTFIFNQDIPLEQRTDVTVDELENLTLPHRGHFRRVGWMIVYS